MEVSKENGIEIYSEALAIANFYDEPEHHDERLANANHAVKCVNANEELVEALGGCVEFFERHHQTYYYNPDVFKRAKLLLAKAKGPSHV